MELLETEARERIRYGPMLKTSESARSKAARYNSIATRPFCLIDTSVYPLKHRVLIVALIFP